MSTISGINSAVTQTVLVDKLKTVPKLKMGNAEMRFEPEDLDSFHLNKAKIELRETPENIAEGLKGLRELLKGEPDLTFPVGDDEHLRKFLRPCKWYPESAFELIKYFYGFRRSHPHLCDNLLPSREKAVLSSGVVTPLPRRCADGARILLIEGGKRWKPKEVTLDQIFKGVMLGLEAAMSEPTTQVCGVKVILDMAGLSLSHVTYFTPSFARAVLEWVQKCLPCRLKAVHIINQPFIFNMVFAIFKPFLQEKLRRRIHFHGSDKAALLQHLDAKAVPERYGGSLDVPNEPLGEPLWEYFCTFEKEFEEANKCGYLRK